MEWLLLIPLAFVMPLLLSLWRKRAIPEGSSVEIVFDLALPSKWAAELTQRALSAEGAASRIHRERKQWLCSVARTMEYHSEAVATMARRLDQVASARGGSCARYKVMLGRRHEVHDCEVEGHGLSI